MATQKKHGILYARFSPRPNAEKCDSIENQFEDLRRYCMEHDIRIMEEHSDKALSGADKDRPGMWDAIHSLKRGMVLVIRSFDRLSRDSVFAAVHVDKIERKGCTVISVNEPGGSANTIEGRLIRSVLFAVNQYEREIIRARTRASMRKHQKNGRRMSKHCPYGWTKDPNDKARMIKNEKERAVIEIVVSYYKQGMPLRDIATKLNESGTKARLGGKWYHSQIRNILDREGFPPGHTFDKDIEGEEDDNRPD